MSEPASEQRSSPRRLWKTSAICLRDGADGEACVAGQVLNVSHEGAQILLRSEFSVGEKFGVILVGIHRRPAAEVRAVVRWVRSEAVGVCRIGVSFVRPLTRNEMDFI